MTVGENRRNLFENFFKISYLSFSPFHSCFCFVCSALCTDRQSKVADYEAAGDDDDDDELHRD